MKRQWLEITTRTAELKNESIEGCYNFTSASNFYKRFILSGSRLQIGRKIGKWKTGRDWHLFHEEEVCMY